MYRFFPILSILLLEIIVNIYTQDLSTNLDTLYSLRARYSARISFTILCTIGAWTTALGLNNIFINSHKRDLLIGGITAFSINHLIHYYFLYHNFEVNGLDISSKYISFGALAYVILSIAPVLVWRWATLTKARYYAIYGFLILMIGICIFTYSSRFGRSLPMSTPMWVFKVMIGIGTTVILLMVGRMIRERKTNWDDLA